MKVAVLCPMSVGIVPGAAGATVVIKATLALREPVAALGDPDPLWGDIPHPNSDELVYSSDLVPSKGRADLLLVGHVYGEAPSFMLPARFSVAAFTRRFFATTTQPSASVPLLPRHLQCMPPLDGGVPSGRPVAARVGPVPVAARHREAPPAFNAAPLEQQVSQIDLTARIVLERLTPGKARLVSRLPGVRPRAFVVGARDHVAEIALRCDTLWIHGDRAVCSLVFRGVVPQTTPHAGSLVVAAETPGEPLAWPVLQSRLSEARWIDLPSQADFVLRAEPVPPRVAAPPAPVLPEDCTTLLDPSTLAKGSPVLPFLPAPPGYAASPPRAPSPAARPARRFDDDQTREFSLSLRESSPVLPFDQSRAVGVDPPASAPLPPVVTPAPASMPAPASAPAPQEPPGEQALPLETYATIKAELWDAANIGEVLARHGLDERTWRLHEQRQAAALAEEARAGGVEQAMALRTALRRARARVSKGGPNHGS